MAATRSRAGNILGTSLIAPVAAANHQTGMFTLGTNFPLRFFKANALAIVERKRQSGWLYLCLLSCVFSSFLWPANGAAADIVDDICRAATHSPSYEQLWHTLRRWQRLPRMDVHIAGFSRQGRPLPLLVVHDPEVPLTDTVRIFLLARQHGTEASGTVACLALARHFACAQGAEERQLLRQLSWIMIPVANPDGMCTGKRVNGAGVDLNRQWSQNSEPEIRAIKKAVQRYQPQALIDMHELPADSSKPAFRENFVQTIGGAQRREAAFVSDCWRTSSHLAQWMALYGFPLNVYYDSAEEDINLCHRYFGLVAGIPAYLFEAKSGPGRPFEQRVRFHVLGALVVANYALHRYYAFAQQGGSPASALNFSPDTEVAVGSSRKTESPADSLPVSLTEPTTAEQQATTRALLEVLQPPEGAIARGFMAICVESSDMPAKGYVLLVIDGQPQALTNASRYEHLLDTRRLSDGRHEVMAEMYDAKGRLLSQCRRYFIVDNSTVAAGE